MLSEFKVRRGKTLRIEERRKGEKKWGENRGGRKKGGREAGKEEEKQVGKQCHPWRQSKLEASIGYTEKP